MAGDWSTEGSGPTFVEPDGLEPLSWESSNPVPPRPVEPDHWAGASPYLMGDAFYEPGHSLTGSDLSPAVISPPTPPPHAPLPYGHPGGYLPHSPDFRTYSMPAYFVPLEHPKATVVLVLGVVGLVMPVLSFIAWYLGGQAREEIRRGAPFPWSGNLRTGYILGKVLGIMAIVATSLYAVWLVALVAFQVHLLALIFGIR